FVQTQQLIWGGRQPGLRRAATIEALEALAAEGHVTAKAADELIHAYEFLRKVEHRLQMINDEQTHALPQDGEGLRELAVFLGYDGAEGFASEILAHMGAVQTHYAALFDEHPSLGAESAVAGNLVFTGAEHDPETLKTLESLGNGNAKMVDETVRKWHHGRYRSTRSARSRGMLTELMPLLLKALSETSDPDLAFLKFDAFLSRLPSGVQVFSMLYANPNLLGLLAEIVGEAPRLASHLSRNPSILDSVLAGGFFESPPSQEDLNAELAQSLDLATERGETLEDLLNVSRRWANDRKFQVGVQILRGHLSPSAASEALSSIAECALGGLSPCVEKEFAAYHGVFPGSGTPGSNMVIAAMGKLGGREMMPVSDLDLIFIYATDPSAEVSNGDRPLSPSQYFSRLSQRLINAVCALTAEGRLYEVDMRLRPSGKAGPIASSYEAFEQYQRESAWTWEHMALTRARVIAGPAALREKVEAVIRETLTRPRDADKLLGDVAGMRARMDEERRAESIWEVKHLRGGLVDIEFIAQYLQLKHAHAHPQILSTNTIEALERIHDAGLLEDGAARDLIQALNLWQGMQLMLRLSFGGPLQEDPPQGFQEKLAEIAAPTACGATLKELIIETAKRTHDHYNNLI
ncbi:MAG TPA: glutamine-synthetase adenylyltransferase, partial [Rhodospirillales bacterium]|nr:glutamine-synthetase adenylyltransferase [Rhodospirillales bacterium]